jgi:hypothetical protein
LKQKTSESEWAAQEEPDGPIRLIFLGFFRTQAGGLFNGWA